MHECLNNVWKEHKWVEVTHSIIHYLYAIDFLLKKQWYARAVDIANNLEITPGSCSISLKNLLKKWFIKEDENRFILLSNMWKSVVEKALGKRKTLMDFFQNKLWIENKKAEINACNIEHLLDDEIIEKLQKYV